MTGPTITSADRLSLTLFLAVVVHALVILGIGFTGPAIKPPRTPPLIEVILAERPAAEAPKNYDYLAQANQDGGGENKEKQRPREQATASAAAAAGPAPTQTAPPPAAAPVQRKQEVVSRRGTEQKAKPTPEKPAVEPQPPTAAELISDSRQLAQSVAHQQELESISARYPSKRYIHARTKAHAAAEYMRQWVEKVERIGNLNYPEEARRRALSGALILEATLRPNGSLVSVRVLDSSRQPVLDQAAMRIVHIAAPFAPIPAEVLAGSDLLVITRTWEFIDQQGLSTRN
ncbi:MAG TPA: TonB family protein [Gammaproteobacteria bacterium]|nr:TonB family protein [Gammaproteobacteria bacterium]